MARSRLTRCGCWLSMVACVLAAGCRDSEERKAMTQAQEAERTALRSMLLISQASGSDSIKDADREKQVVEATQKAQKALQDAMTAAPGYWPLHARMGALMAQDGEFWAMRMEQLLASSQGSLVRSNTEFDQLRMLRQFVWLWQELKGGYAASSEKVNAERAMLQEQLTDAEKQLATAKSRQDDLLKQAAENKTRSAGLKAEAEKLKGQSLDKPGDLDLLSQALKRGVDADRVGLDAMALERQAEMAGSRVARETVRVEAIKVRISGQKTHDDKVLGGLDEASKTYQEMLAGVKAVFEGTEAAGLAASEKGLQDRIAELKKSVEAQSKAVVQDLAAAEAAARNAKAAYRMAIQELGKAHQAAAEMNRKALESAPASAEGEPVVDSQSELHLLIDQAAAQTRLAQVESRLADAAAAFQNATKLAAGVQLFLASETRGGESAKEFSQAMDQLASPGFDAPLAAAKQLLGDTVPAAAPVVDPAAELSDAASNLTSAARNLKTAGDNAQAKANPHWSGAIKDQRAAVERLLTGTPTTAPATNP